MSDTHARMIEQLRNEDPAFGVEYDKHAARRAFVVPIVEARRARGWSQRDLAAASGVQQPVIARFEVGDTDPKASTLKKLWTALDLEIAYLDSSGRRVG